MKHEEIYNTVRMICGSLLMVGMFMIPSCEDNKAVEEVLEPSMQMWVNGDPISPYTYYAQVNTYGEKTLGEDGKIKKLFVLHLQREVGRVLPTLEHYAAVWYDEDAEDNSDLIDPGLYLNYGPTDTLAHTREQTLTMEITGTDDYVEFGQSEIYVNNDNKISGMANGKFWNPYRNEMQIGLLIFENIEIGTDPEATFYTGE
tara:strand:+ start:443 stop:1045 length:603 start_codon:yes stop_codon:yes gene_type:complete